MSYYILRFVCSYLFDAPALPMWAKLLCTIPCSWGDKVLLSFNLGIFATAHAMVKLWPLTAIPPSYYHPGETLQLLFERHAALSTCMAIKNWGTVIIFCATNLNIIYSTFQ